MHLNARQITNGTLEIISQALKDEAPENGRNTWISETADNLGVSEPSLKYWLYGKGAPGTPALLAMIAYFGPRFANKVLRMTGYHLVKIEDDPGQLRRRSGLSSGQSATIGRGDTWP